MKRYSLFIFFTFYILVNNNVSLIAQDSLVTVPSQQTPYLWTEFSKQSITWDWFSRMWLYNNQNEHWRYDVKNFFRSNLIHASADNKQWKDEYNFNGRFYYHTPSFSPGIYTKSWLQSDRSAGIENNFSNHVLGTFIQTKYITPYLGYQQSKNLSLSEWGWDAGMTSSVKDLQFDIYRTNLELESNYDFYDKRQNYDNTLNLSIQSKFSNFSGDSVSFNFSEVSKQYYSSGKLEHVKIYNRSIQNNLYYYLSMRDYFTLQTQIDSRSTSYFNGRNVFSIINNLKYIHNGPKLFLGLQLRTNDATENNSGIITDSRALQTALRVEAGYSFNRDQRFNLDLAYVKLQYDTPDDEVNHDDRDEQRFIFNLGYYHRFSPNLFLNVYAYSYLFHQIYIFSERSINNNWNRIFKLNPQVDYSQGRIRNKLSTEVLANYTVYDFEHLIRQTRSYIFRKYTLSDSLKVRVYGSNSAGLYIKFELEDKGSFFKNDYKQQLLQSYKSEFYNFYLVNEHFIYFKVMAGYTVYRRREWRHIPKKKLSRTITNRGPFVNIAYHASQNIFFSANASLSEIDDSAYQKSKYTTGHIRLNYLF